MCHNELKSLKTRFKYLTNHTKSMPAKVMEGLQIWEENVLVVIIADDALILAESLKALVMVRCDGDSNGECMY